MAGNEKGVEILAKFYHEDNGECFSNPGMGWVIHHDIRKGKKDGNEPDHYENLDNVALLSWWAHLQQREEDFTFEDLDASVAKWKGLGKKLQFRISSDPMLYDGQGQGAPDWLYEKYNVPFQAVQEDGYKTRYPDYLNPDYQKALRRFLCALADRYGDEEALETVDLRAYGAWGEWHSGYQHPTYAQHAAALRSLIDAWEYAFSGKKTLILSCSYEWMKDRKPPLHAPKSYEEYLYWSGFDYAMTKPGISLRRDGIGGAVKIWDARLMREFYRSGRRLPMIAEYFNGYTIKNSDAGSRGYFVEDTVEEALMLHPNYMMLMWDSVQFYEERPDLIEHGLKRMGYRLLPESVEIPEVCGEEAYITLVHSWVNRGAGRFCAGGHLKIRIAGQVTEEKGFDPGALSEGERKVYRTPVKAPEHVNDGVYPVEFAVCGYGGQSIRLPLDGRSEDGYYPVGNLIIARKNKGM